MVARRQSALAFVGWAVLGAVGALGLLSITVVGLLAFMVVVIVVLVLFVRLGAPYAAIGAILGLALPLFYVAWLNREGPGTVCHALGNAGEECTDMWSPWPWALVGLVLVGVGVAAYVRARRAATTGPVPV